MKFFSIALMSVGLLSSLFGLIPAVFIYPFKLWDTTSQYWNFILFKDLNRLYWQLGLPVLLVGIFLFVKSKKSKKQPH